MLSFELLLSSSMIIFRSTHTWENEYGCSNKSLGKFMGKQGKFMVAGWSLFLLNKGKCFCTGFNFVKIHANEMACGFEQKVHFFAAKATAPTFSSDESQFWLGLIVPDSALNNQYSGNNFWLGNIS